MDFGLLVSSIGNNPLEFLAWLAVLLLKTTVILLVSYTIVSLMKKSPASARHLVWTFSLVAVMLLPAIPVFLPQWDLPLLPDLSSVRSEEEIFPNWGQSQSLNDESITNPQGNIDNPTVDSTITSTAVTNTRVLRAKATEQASLKAPNTLGNQNLNPTVLGKSVTTDTNPFGFSLIFLSVWIIGIVANFVWLISGMTSVALSVKNSPLITHQDWLEDLESTKNKLDITSPVKLVFSNHFDYPLVSGFFRPTLVIPEKGLNWGDQKRRIVLLHELAHIKRKDPAIQLLVHFSLPLNWFNPLAWFAVNNLLHEQELSCDDQVIKAGIKPSFYATQLLEITQIMKGRATWAVASMARKSEIKGRIMSILNPEKNRKSTGKLFAVVLALTCISLVLPLASAQIWSETPADFETDPSSKAPEKALPEDELTQDDPKQERFKLEELDMDKLISELGSSDAYTRAKSAFYLSVFKKKAVGAIPLLIEMLKDDQKIRVNFRFDHPGKKDSYMMWKGTATPGGLAVHALKQLIGIERVESIIQLLEKGNEHARYNAVRILRKMEDKKVNDAIASVIDDPSPEVRKIAITAIRKLKDKSYLAVIGARVTDSNPDVRELAIRSLRDFEDVACIDYLAKAVDDPDSELRSLALRGLQDLDTEDSRVAAIPFLKDKNAEVRYRALRVLREDRSPEAVAAMKTALHDLDEKNRLVAIRSLVDLKDKSLISPLAKLKDDGSIDVRYYAVKALRNMKTSTTLQALSGFLNDTDKSIRSITVRALRDLNDISAVPPLQKLIRTEEDPDILILIDKTIKNLESK